MPLQELTTLNNEGSFNSFICITGAYMYHRNKVIVTNWELAWIYVGFSDLYLALEKHTEIWEDEVVE